MVVSDWGNARIPSPPSQWKLKMHFGLEDARRIVPAVRTGTLGIHDVCAKRS